MIRRADKKDIEAIREIYNDAVLNTTATFDIEPRTYEQQVEWFKQHDNKFQILVDEVNTVISGWASLSRWSDRPAYEGTAENSVYVKKEFQRKGIGRKLLSALIQNARENGLHTIIARIAEDNETSIRMHAESGFIIIGVMKEAGRKFDRYIDVTLMQKIL